jgi:uncharacterized protein (TIGR02118 family)
VIKLIVGCKRKAGLSRQQFIDYWKNRHAPLAMEDPQFWSRVRRYVQNYCMPVGTGQFSGTPAWDGAAELWFDSVEEMEAAFSGRRTVEILVPDLANFIELESAVFLVSEENVIYSGAVA